MTPTSPFAFFHRAFDLALRPFLDERERWFLWLPVLIAGGIAAYHLLTLEPSCLWLAASPSLGLLAFLSRNRHEGSAFLWVFLAVALGFNAAQIETLWSRAPMLDAPSAGPVSTTGLLYSAESVPGGTRLTIKNPFIREIPKERRLRFARIKVREPLADLPEAGKRINVWGPLWPPSEPVAPGDYDFRRHSFFSQLGASGLSYSEVRERTAKNKPPFFWDGFNLMFERARRALTLMALERLPAEEAPMTAALLSGSQSGIDRDVMQAMRVSGLSHLLSISGVHVSMVGLLVYAPLRFLLALVPWIALRWPIKKIAAGAAILSTSLYTVLVGPQTPTVRSALTTGIIMFAVLVDRKATSLRLVALAAMLLMLTVPSAVIGPSFEMSFAAVVAMVAAYEKRLDAAIKKGLAVDLPEWMKNLWKAGRDILLTSLVATAATTPFTLYHFQTFSFYGVVSNMIAIPLTSFWVMPCLLLTYLAGPFGGAGWFLDGAGFGIKLIIHLAQTVAAWPFSQIYLPPMPNWAFALFLLGGLWLCLWQRRWRFAGLLPIAVACFYPLTVTLPTIFIAPEGALWAARLADGRLAAFGKKAENFTTHQWRQRTMNPEVVYYTQKDKPGENGELSCGAFSCAFRREGFSVVFLLKKAPPETIEAACASQAAVIVAPFALPDCPVPHIIDKAALHERGAHTITLSKDGPQIETARTARGTRPWVVGWKQASP